MSRYRTAGEVINSCAVELGLSSVVDPFGSNDKNFKQLTELLNLAGEELLTMNVWQQFIKEHSLTTAAGDSGEYDLPDDFLYMIDQTGWDFTREFPLIGPLTDAQWKWLEGSGVVTGTVYLSFRIAAGKFSMQPQPPPQGLTVKFEYVSKNWVILSDATSAERCVASGDVPQYDAMLLRKFLKFKWLEAKGFDTTSAAGQLQAQFNSVVGNARSAPVVNLSRNSGFPYLDPLRNFPDRNYGV